MGAILHSTWGGIYSGTLARIIYAQGIDQTLLKRPSPPVLDAFIYGTAVSLAHRFIEHQGKEHFKKYGLLCVIGIIALKILTPYLLKPLLKKGLDIEVPTIFIHLENGIYLLALIDGEFEYLAMRIKPDWNGEYHPFSVRANMTHLLEKKYRSLFD